MIKFKVNGGGLFLPTKQERGTNGLIVCPQPLSMKGGK